MSYPTSSKAQFWDGSAWIDWPGGALSDTLSRIESMPRVGAANLVDDGANLVRQRAATAVDGTTAKPAGAQGAFVLVAGGALSGTPNVNAARAGSGLSDSGAGSTALAVASMGYTAGGSTLWERQRMANVVKAATATASGDTAVWTPASGRKFRLMRFAIQVTADAATAGGANIDIVLRDATTALAPSLSLFIPAVAGTSFGNNVSTGWCDIGHGLLSAAANNVLNVNLSAALTAGKVRVVVAGTEE